MLRKMARKAKTVINVNRHVIAANKKNNLCEPPISIKHKKENLYAHGGAILDKDGNEVARIVYTPDKPLSCGATVYITAHHGVRPLEKND